MRPVLFHVFGIPVYSYGFMLAVAFAIGTMSVARVARGKGIDPNHILDLGIITCLSAIVGSRLVFVLLNLSWYMADPVRVIGLSDGGLSFHGGLAAGIGSGIIYCRWRGIDRWSMADIVAPFMALGYSIVRIGCFLRGCCYGVPTDVPWAMPVAETDDLLRHPTQLYSSALSLLLFLYLYSRREHRGFRGMLMLQYVGVYSLIRFAVEFVRDGQRLIVGLTLAQLVSLPVAVVAFTVLAVLSRRSRTAGRAAVETRVS